MKVIGEAESVIQNALSGESNQVHNEKITKVLLADGNWYHVEPGSFKMYRTGNKLPFIRFDTTFGNNNVVHTLEIFPNALHGVGFPKDSESEIIAEVVEL